MVKLYSVIVSQHDDLARLNANIIRLIDSESDWPFKKKDYYMYALKYTVYTVAQRHV